ncbi:MAG: ABC transporter permease, partial [Desulfovibrionaceae bacterium]
MEKPFSFELFVALRYLFSRRKQTFIYVISLMSILGVALGVGALVVVLGVYNGFSSDMRDKILGANAHAIVMSHLPATLTDEPGMLRRINAVPGVTGSTPFLYSEVMLSAAGGVKGLVLRGIDPATAPGVLSMLRQLEEGSVERLSAEGTPGIIIGLELARRLGLAVGDRVNLLSPSGRKGAAGFQPRIVPFEIAGVFRCGLFEYDSSLAFVTLDAARDVLGLPAGRVTGIELTVDDVYKADSIGMAVEAKLGAPFYVRNWMEMNANLFAALKLEKIGMFILLTIVVLIGSFSIVTSLVMLVMEKTRDIAILMSMGATRGMIRRIFMLQGTIIGAVGTILGYALGLTVALLLQKYQFIELPK